MANGADGSIVIDTQLDNTGFQRGSKQMQHAITSLNGSVNQTGQNMQSAVQSMNTALQDMGAAAQTAGSKFAQYFGAGQFDQALGTVQKSAQSLVSDLAKIGNAEAAGVKPGAQFTRLQANIEQAERRLETLKSQMEQLSGVTFETPAIQSLQQRYDGLVEKFEAAQAKLNQMRDMGFNDSSLQSYIQTCNDIERQIDAVAQKMIQLDESGESYTTGADTAGYQQLAAMYAQMTQALEVYKQAAAGFNVIQGPANQSEQALANVDRELQQKGPDAEQARGFLSGLGRTLSSLGKTALRTAGGLARLTFKGVAAGTKGALSGIKGFVTGLKNLRKHSSQSSLTTNGLVKALFSVKRMLLSRFKETFITSLFNGMKAGMQSFARYSSSFNVAMSSMKNSMTGLSGNLAVFAGGLVSAIAPAISTIIDWISKAITYLNAFFALLSGKSTYSVAKKGTDDYAKSLKGAGGAAKDLKNQVYGFDELNRADDNKSGGGGSGSGGKVDFTEESLNNLPSALTDFMQSIKDAFSAGQFEEVGAIVGRGLNTIVTTIDNWINNKFRPFAVTWAQNIVRILNGLVGAFDWTNFGKLFADGFNAITDTLNTFFSAFDFDELARGFGDGLNGLFGNVDWALLGQMAGNGLQGIWTMIIGTLANFDWVSLGSNLATGVNSLFQTIDWAKAGTQLSNEVKGVLDGITQLLVDTDWQAIGNSIAEFVGAIDWNGLADSLFTGIGAALASIGELIWGILQPAWNSVVTWWDAEMQTNGGNVIQTLLNGIVTALSNIGQWCLDHIIKPLVSGIESALGLEQGTIAKTATQFWTDFKTAIETAWNTVKTAVSEFFTGVWEAIVGFFGTLGDTATNVWSDFTTGLSNGWNAIATTVTSFFTGVWSSITGFFGTLGDTAKGIWSDFTTGISSGWNAVKTTVTNTVTGAWNSIKGVFTGVGDVATQIWNGLKDGLSTGWTSLKESILQPFKDMWQAVKDFFGIASPSTEAASVGDFILQGLVNGFSSAVEGVITTVKEIFGRIWNAIKSIFGFGSQGGENAESKEAEQAGKDIMTGMKDGIKGDEETVKAEIKNAGKVALQALRAELGIPESGGASTKTKTIGENLMTGLSDGIKAKSVEATFKSVADSAWKAVKAALNTAFGTKENGSASKAKYVGETTVKGVNDGINNKAKSNTFTTVATAALTSVKSALNTAFGLNSDTSSASKTKYVGEGSVKGIVDGIKAKAINSTFTSVASSVYSAISSAFNTALGISGGGWWGGNSSSSKFKDVGKAICQGVADGIDANTSTIKSAAERAAQAALTAAKSKLGIHSPSKAFAEIGNFMMAGMSNGLKDGQSDVARTVSGIAASLTKGMSGTIFDTGADATVSGLDRISEKLSAIADIFTAIASAIGDLGGSLPVPAVATGEFAPYRVRQDADNWGAASDVANELRRQESGRDELMYMIRDEIRNGFSALLRKNNVIDGASLERQLARLRRDRERSLDGDFY